MYREFEKMPFPDTSKAQMYRDFRKHTFSDTDFRQFVSEKPGL